MYVESFKELIVWQRAMEVVRDAYKVTASLPESERYGLTSQIRRAAVSIPSNIAEGKKRKTKKDFLQFLRVADGSAAELETLLMIAQDIYPQGNFVSALPRLEEVQKMFTTLIKKLEASTS